MKTLLLSLVIGLVLAMMLLLDSPKETCAERDAYAKARVSFDECIRAIERSR